MLSLSKWANQDESHSSGRELLSMNSTFANQMSVAVIRDIACTKACTVGTSSPSLRDKRSSPFEIFRLAIVWNLRA